MSALRIGVTGPAMAAIAVNEDGYREVLGSNEGFKEDKAGWVNFFRGSGDGA